MEPQTRTNEDMPVWTAGTDTLVVTIPKKTRDALHIVDGDTVTYTIQKTKSKKENEVQKESDVPTIDTTQRVTKRVHVGGR